ncbi:MAG: family transcriptional regulator, dissimilatory nitrate respiration regulator [Alphaproteobacteria bacterium]|jgi:CRP-like cAMP-binding protein|nr:family transcriptional regulator, dissimilatory nitrate respiration regulator [Alphaproteobacteria bacterium]
MIAIMSASLIDTLSKLANRDQTLAVGEILFRAGDPVLSLFLVASGVVRLTRPLPHGLQLTLQRASSGAILAEASLYADCYHCDALAAESSLVHVVPLQSIKTRPYWKIEISRALGQLTWHMRCSTREPKWKCCR